MAIEPQFFHIAPQSWHFLPSPKLKRIQEKWVPVFRPNARPNKNLEHFRAKWTPVRVKKMRPDKNLERFRDSVKFGNALNDARVLSAPLVAFLIRMRTKYPLRRNRNSGSIAKAKTAFAQSAWSAT